MQAPSPLILLNVSRSTDNGSWGAWSPPLPTSPEGDERGLGDSGGGGSHPKGPAPKGAGRPGPAPKCVLEYCNGLRDHGAVTLVLVS